MPGIPIRNRIRSAIGGLFRRPMIRAKDRFLEVAASSCRETQQATLLRLLRLNQESEFSRTHKLAANTTLTEFRDRIPVSDYEYFRPYIDRLRQGDHAALLGSRNRLLMFALSSGTTAAAKLIPITDPFVRDYRRGWQHWGISVHQAHPQLKLSKIVQLTSRHDQWTTEDGTACGSISGLVTSMQKTIVRKLYSVAVAVSEIDDPIDKRHAVARFAFGDPLVGMLVTANPSTLLQLVREIDVDRIIRDVCDGTLSIKLPTTTAGKLKAFLRPDKQRAAQLERIVATHNCLAPRKCWPQLNCLGVWTGGSAGSYIPQLREAFGDVAVRDHGLHASEGRMTIPFFDHTAAGLLDIESHFFEFVPVAEMHSERPVTLLSHELQSDCDYYILLTTSSGLYRYNINDVVRCTGFHGTTPLLEFRHKGAHVSSITGEKISEAQVVEAVAAACQNSHLRLTQFTLTPLWQTLPCYELFVGLPNDVSPSSAKVRQLAEATDAELCQRNCEYAEKRNSGRLGIIECHLVDAASWQRFRGARLKSTGGSPEQYKHPCLLPDHDFQSRFRVSARLPEKRGLKPDVRR